MRSLFCVVDLSIRGWLSAVSSFIEYPYLKSCVWFIHLSTNGNVFYAVFDPHYLSSEPSHQLF